MTKLTPKQRAFCDYYIELGGTERAALKAGYSKTYARKQSHKLLANVGIKIYIEERMKEIEDKRIAKADEVLKTLTAILRDEVKEEVIVVEAIGDFESRARIVQKRMSAKDRIKAAELLGKRYAVWTDKQQIENITPVFVDDVPDDD